MFRLYTTPTEALLQVAKEHPFKLAVMSGRDQWSYAALWARVKQIADKITDFDDGARCPIDLYMSLEIDYVSAAHAIWLSGRTTVFLSSNWTPDVLQVFRVFADFAQMRFGGSQVPNGFNRIYRVVIDSESLSIYGLELAHVIFPSAAIACSYACSEVGFAGISQMFIRPTDPMPSVISFGATQGCTDLVLLDESLSVIPKTSDKVTGTVAFITSHSATHYLANDEASHHMFRPWKGDDILIYTDDVGCMQPDGTIAIRGRSLRNIEVNGLFIDLDCVERALAPAFADSSLKVTNFKLVKSSTTDKIVLFACPETLDSLSLFERARDYLHTSFPDNLAMVNSAVRCIPLMPFNGSYKIDLAALQKMTDPKESFAPCAVPSTFDSSAHKVDVLAEEITAEITKLSKSSEMVTTDVPILYSGLNSITMARLFIWLQSEYEYMEEMAHLFEEHITPLTLAAEILGEETVSQLDDTDLLAEHITAHITKLTRSTETVPKDVPLLYSGLKSITMARLFMWLRVEYAYKGEMAHLFDEEVTAAVLAMEILGRDNHDRETPVKAEDSHTDLCSDTVVRDQSTSENSFLEKDLERSHERARVAESVSEVTYDSASEHDVYQFVVVDESDSESDSDQEQTRSSPIVDVSHRRTSFFIVDVDNSDSSGDSSDDDQARRRQREQRPASRRYPKVPASPLFPGLKSPFRSAFGYTFDEDDHVLDGSVLPDSPLLGSFVFSSFIVPVRDRATKQQPLDSMLARLST